MKMTAICAKLPICAKLQTSVNDSVWEVVELLLVVNALVQGQSLRSWCFSPDVDAQDLDGLKKREIPAVLGAAGGS